MMLGMLAQSMVATVLSRDPIVVQLRRKTVQYLDLKLKTYLEKAKMHLEVAPIWKKIRNTLMKI